MKNMSPIVAIIGGGPAGITAAIQLKRTGVATILFEGDQLGGLLKNAFMVENYPGFPGGIPGEELVKRLKTQVETFKLDVKYERVSRLELLDTVNRETFRITTPTSIHYADRIIVASGTKAKKSAPLTSLPPSPGKYIFHQVFPIRHAKGKRVVVIGAGDAAFDYALRLSGSNEVFILNKGERIKALPLLVKRAKRIKNIHYVANCRMARVEAGKEKQLRVICVKEKREQQIEADYLLCAVGREPQLDFLTGDILGVTAELQNRGRLYFAGDVKNGIFRQAAIAAGNGLESAMRIYENIGGKNESNW